MKPLLFLIPVALAAQYRIVYPLSVVPGGIDAATANEHITHTEDFFHQAVLRRSRYYIQFTQAGVTGWTGETKSIPQGTECFVDRYGNIKRSRCGNELSKVPRLPHLTAPLPPDKDLETPKTVDVTPPEMLPRMPEVIGLYPPGMPIYIDNPLTPPDEITEQPPITLRPNYPAPYWVPPVSISPGLFMPIPPPAPTVPEPSYKWLLVGLALCAVVVLWWSRTNPKDKD